MATQCDSRDYGTGPRCQLPHGHAGWHLADHVGGFQEWRAGAGAYSVSVSPTH